MNARRMILVGLASLGSLAVGLTLSVSVVLAAALPSIEGSSVLDVAATSGTLQAQIDPEGSETTYRFEYGTSETYGQSVPVPDGLAGSGSSAVTVQAHPQDLSPGTTYHFRVVVSSTGGTVDGADRVFTTQQIGVAPSLPDGRAWEMVSPADKHGAQVTNRFSIQASEDGSAIAYDATGPFAGESSPANLQGSQALSRRGADGWSTQAISPHNDEPVTRSGQQEYQFFSPDLSRALVSPLGETSLAPEATEKTVYVRDNATGSYTPLVTASNVAPGAKFGGEEYTDGVFSVTATSDLSHVVISSIEVALTSTPGDEGGLYEWSDGKLQYIAGRDSAIGSQYNGNTRHAVSDDGSRIFWSEDTGQQQLYMTDTVTGETIRVNAAQGVSEPESNIPQFQLASNDGTKVFFTESGRLTTDSRAEPSKGDLYELEIGAGPGPLSGTLRDLTTEAEHGADVQGIVIGASEDGSYLYLVAGGVLSANENGEHETAVAGANNLYVLHSEVQDGVTEWSASFIAGLSSEDAPSWKPRDSGTPEMNTLTSRVSPNGRYVTFMSERSLTGYDNIDAHSGQRDEEVYLYDAVSGRLACASCNPDGGRPEGRQEGEEGKGSLAESSGAWANRWLAASIPGWNGAGQTRIELRSLAYYQPRYLSDGGRLFFDSSDALVPQDVNGTGDVYQYESAGAGTCVDERGCVSLISGGVGPDESVFADASASGEDAFFMTDDRLLSKDVDSGYDMYDAHVCSDRVPCLPASTSSPPPCDTGDSCKPAPQPQPAIFGAPPSATFSGEGNVLSPAPKAVATQRRLTRAQKLAQALHACRRKRGRRARAECRRRVERQYARKSARSARPSKAHTSASRRAGR